MQRRLAWRALAIGSGVLAGIATRAALTTAYKRIQHADPPVNPVSKKTSWPEALTWTIAVAVSMGITRVVAQRGAAEAWHAATGSYPEDLESSG
jgi:hypothetical protein